tara:strand:+ start:1010 stop:1261 length:252 start_codon:yes stop_codon:yes gene_type:complete
MDELLIISKTQKALRSRLQAIGDNILAGGVDNMEKYKYLIGQAHALQLTLHEISNLLNDKEQKDDKGNVVNIGDTNSKGKTTN